MADLVGAFSQLPTTAYAGFRNRVANGGCQVAQQFGTTSVTMTTTNQWPVDNWAFGALTTASKLAAVQSTDAPVGFTNSISISVSSSYTPAGNEYFLLSQFVEGYNCQDFQMGVTANINFTVSFWVKGSVAGTYSAAIANYNSSETYTFNYTVTTSWAQVQVTIPSTTSGTWNTANLTGIRVYFNLGASGTYATSTANTWQSGTFVSLSGSTQFVSQTNGSTLKFTGLQVELGSAATPFEQRSYTMELGLCQRYLALFSNIGGLEITGYSYNTTESIFQPFFPVTMRAAPTLITSAMSTFTLYNGSLGGSGNPTSIVLNNSSVSTGCFSTITTAGSPTIVAGQGALLNFNSTSSYMGFTAQL